MDLPPLHPVSLLLAWITVAAARVEPPTNVTLHCHNLTNVLEWDYDHHTPGLRFRVDINSYSGLDTSLPGELWVDPPSQQLDVSILSDPAEEYSLTVTAVVGQKESEPSPSQDGITFSYSQASQVHQNCFVDLPSVDITLQPHGKVSFRFEHPWLFYQHKLPDGRQPKVRRKKSNDEEIPAFYYDVGIISISTSSTPSAVYEPDGGNKLWTHRKEEFLGFVCEESVCEEELVVDAAKDKHCLKISGELQQMMVKGKQDYCTVPVTAVSYVYIFVGLGLLALLTLAFIFYMVYQKMTKPTTELPSSMNFNRVVGPSHVRVDVPEVQPASPTPLLGTTEEEDGSESPPAVTSDCDFRMPLGVSSDDIEVGQPNGESDAYMQGNCLEEEETLSEANSGYERRAVLVQLGPDEMTTGYRG